LRDPKIERLLRNYSNARRSWESWCFMANFNLDNRNQGIVRFIDDNPLLFHLRYLALKDFHIEIYKILKESRNSTDNIFYLLKDLMKNDPIKKFDVEINLLKLKDINQTIKDLCDLRDKYYAHTDEDYESYLSVKVSLPSILLCFIAIEKSIITLTSIEVIQDLLDKIPSRNDFRLI
jgi:hypothetical protein